MTTNVLLTTLLAAATVLPVQVERIPAATVELDWDRRAVEHLWNRAGFGVAADEIDAWVAAGPEALVDHLFAVRRGDRTPLSRRFESTLNEFDAEVGSPASRKERFETRRRRRLIENDLLQDLRSAWMESILEGDDPLRDRMTLFWHGVFTTSFTSVRRPDALARQYETLRGGALGSYAVLLRAMLRDTALLEYLDNDENRRGSPNENLAREVMELFALGEGHYSEADVREAARALTGATRGDDGAYQFDEGQHDDGVKTILGVTGTHGPNDLATILLDRPECASFLARSLLEYLEGVPASPARVDQYAELLRETDYDVGRFLRTLFLDPGFYRAEVVGARVAGPIDFVAGAERRLGLGVPPDFAADAAAALGQDLFRPPSVKGWDEGFAWISTSTLMLRGNVIGAMLDLIDVETVRGDMRGAVRSELGLGGASRDDMREMSREQFRRDALSRLAKSLRESDYEPSAYLGTIVRGAGARTDEEAVRVLADALLAIEPPEETIAMLIVRLAELRDAFGVTEEQLAQNRRRTENALLRLGHLLLSLPEAQLH
ncbi:MAG: DUF1800 domain-containing protein [Planctomycetota bacterium]